LGCKFGSNLGICDVVEGTDDFFRMPGCSDFTVGITCIEEPDKFRVTFVV
jgi:hypothetical protein